MRDKGSISVFFSIIIPLVLVVLMVVTELSYYHFLLQRELSGLYLDLDNSLSGFHRQLFNELGLLAFEGAEGEAPLSEKKVLEESIMLLMEEAQLRDGIYLAENLASEFLQSKLGLDFSLFDLGELNRELSEIIAKAKEGKLSEKVRLEFFAKALAMSPYVHLQGIGLNQLKRLIEEGNVEALKEINPIFVISEDIRDNYKIWREAVTKYDVLNILGSYSLADYSVDYLGYSMTKKEDKDLRSEYILTGLEPGALQTSLVKAELYGVRLAFNLIECFFNPKVRAKISSLSGEDPRLFLLFSLGQAAMETGVDLVRILDREKVPLYKGVEGFTTLGKKGKYSEGWSYPSYLKILLGLTPKSLYFSRLVEAIEHNYEISLDRFYTGLTIEKELKFKGRFIPFELEKHLEGGLYYVKPEG